MEMLLWEYEGEGLYFLLAVWIFTTSQLRNTLKHLFITSSAEKLQITSHVM